MKIYLVAAAIIAVIVGIVHSALGEILIFKQLRASRIIPTKPAPPLRARNVRILWATWHLASVFGWAFAGILFTLAQDSVSVHTAALNATIFAFLGGSLLVLIATKGKHPGWLGLLAVAALAFLSSTT
ncbi:MAG: hypothetical protein HN390_02075 [Anaerolineae bacterium]|jgi:hypothetical protein|nr:hypothetical protein [Anaerolineae bacterium]MBT7189045.1 hypothetical protein [Anaerolineae bacterium]MBT7990318.1 hypothetical protein [Anaerolineae bacterium]